MGKPKSPRAVTGSCELAKGLDRPVTAATDNMINRLSAHSVTKQINPQKSPLVVKAQIVSPARHHPYSTRNRAKTKHIQEQIEDVSLNYEHTYLSSEIGDSWDDALQAQKLYQDLMPIEGNQLEDSTFNTLELYITRGVDANDIHVSPATTTGDVLSNLCDTSGLTNMAVPSTNTQTEGDVTYLTSQSDVSYDTSVAQTNNQTQLKEDGDGTVTTSHFDSCDDQIMKATVKALESGSLTPLIKQELRCTIQSRRLAEGKGEMKVEFMPPPKKKEMTDDERRRALKRRTQNKQAAQRFRQRQKDTSDYLTAKIERLQAASSNLMKDIEFLRKEKEQLQQMLNGHLQVCSRSLPDMAGIDANQLLSTLGYSQDQSTETVSTDCLSSSPCGHSHLPSTTSQLSTASTSSELSEPPSASTCPNTGESTSSVFFSDDDIAHSQNALSLLGSDQTYALMSVAEDCFQTYTDVSTLETCADEQVPFACYEEVIEGIGSSKGFQEEENRRLDSCSVVDSASVCGASHGSCSPCLSESTSLGDLRHNLTSANAKVRLSSNGSDSFEPKLSTDDSVLSGTEEDDYLDLFKLLF